MMCDFLEKDTALYMCSHTYFSWILGYDGIFHFLYSQGNIIKTYFHKNLSNSKWENCRTNYKLISLIDFHCENEVTIFISIVGLSRDVRLFRLFQLFRLFWLYWLFWYFWLFWLFWSLIILMADILIIPMLDYSDKVSPIE